MAKQSRQARRSEHCGPRLRHPPAVDTLPLLQGVHPFRAHPPCAKLFLQRTQLLLYHTGCFSTMHILCAGIGHNIRGLLAGLTPQKRSLIGGSRGEGGPPVGHQGGGSTDPEQAVADQHAAVVAGVPVLRAAQPTAAKLSFKLKQTLLSCSSFPSLPTIAGLGAIVLHSMRCC